MSVIKNRKLISNISPSITHNINSPSKKFQNRSVQTLTSSINSKLRHGRCRCPLIQRSLDYNQLQEMAKEIQEESLEDHLNDEEQKEETSKNDDIFANDKEEGDQILVWTIDPSRQKRCTCTSGKGLTFEQVLSNFQMASEIKNCGAKNTKQPRITLLPAHKSARIPLNTTISKHRTRNWVKSAINNNNDQDIETPNTIYKEQKSNLQTVLKGLHDEFFTLNSKYQELDTQVKNNKEKTSLETLKKLEDMERALNRKEEEIKTVMSLYRDMLILKNQIRKLKEQKRISVRLSESLSKSEFQILKQIQTYQDTL